MDLPQQLDFFCWFARRARKGERALKLASARIRTFLEDLLNSMAGREFDGLDQGLIDEAQQ